MSEVVQNAEREFWRPPVVAQPVALESTTKSGLVEACDRCETEFLPGSHYCHVCGAVRSPQGASHRVRQWMQVALDWFRHLEFHKVERGFVQAKLQLGLRNASLAAFGVGMICLIGALGVGLIFSVQTTLDWQAVQLWRIEWLLGATASFLAGILLKKSAN
jgi:hypothetical protein